MIRHDSPRIATALLVWGLLAAGNVLAEQCPLVPDGTATLEGSQSADLLVDGKFAQLEADLAKRYQKNMASEGGDLLTLRSMAELLQFSMQNENLVRMWASTRPQSFFSQFAAGMFYANQAANILGGKPMSQASPSQIGKVRKLDATATGYLQKAMQLDARSTLPHSIMIGIAAREGQAGGKNAVQWLQAANQENPRNLAARINAITFLSPRWGGSFKLLDQVVQQARKSLPAQGLYYLAYTVVLARASHEEVITGNKSQANALYRRAKELCDNSSAAREGIMRTYR